MPETRVANNPLSLSNPLLFLSAHLPVERSRQAGHKTAWRNLEWLSARHPVHLITFRAEGDRDEPLAALEALCARVQVIDVTRGFRLRGLLARPWFPLCVAARHSDKVRQLVRQWSRENRFGRFHAEWSQLAQYVDLVAEVPTRTLYIHDVLSQYAGRKAAGRRGRFWSWEAARTRRWETRVYGKFSRIFVPSDKDAGLITHEDPALAERVAVLPLHFDIYGSGDRRRHDGPLRLLFWGALGRPENAEAAIWLLDKVVPLLRAARVPFILVLAGSGPPKQIEAKRSKDVEVTGFLADPSDQFARADLAVLPLFQGAGVKVKVLECLAAGLPVLTTGIGAEGIPASGHDGLQVLAPEATEFVRSIARFAEDRASLGRLGSAAAAWGQRQGRDHRRVLVEA